MTPPAPAAEILDLVNEQAEDEGLWFEAVYVSEAYLQQELRRLHATIERHLGSGVPPPRQPTVWILTLDLDRLTGSVIDAYTLAPNDEEAKRDAVREALERSVRP